MKHDVDLPSLLGMAALNAPVALGLLVLRDLTRRVWRGTPRG
jgi:hypothetical protein